MRVAITGSRKLSNADIIGLIRVVHTLVYEVRPEVVVFGGAVGVDTEALTVAQHLKSYNGHTVPSHNSRLVVVVPDTVTAQPRAARDAILRYADEVVELRNPITRSDGFAAYHKRNAEMVKRATHVLGFWNGDFQSGTYSCLCEARRANREIWVECIDGR